MSKFEDNPFGEPMVDNPFADPPIVQPTQTKTTTSHSHAPPMNNVLDDFNPFEDERHMEGNIGQPAIFQPTQQNVPAYNNNINNQNSQQAYGSSGISNSNIGGGPPPAHMSTAELQRRQEELERKAQELDRREEELRNSAQGIRRNNWPPLPEKCCFQPCFYQDINIDIPSEFQKIVRQLYYLWMFYALIMCVNVLGGMILMFHAGAFSVFGLAIMYAFLFTPLSFLCWYRPAYKAFRSDSSFNFMVFFFVFFFQMILLIIQTIGIPGSGYCGFITALSQFDGTPSGIIVGILLLIIAMAFAVCASGNVMLITKIHSIYRHSDSVSFNKAQAEFTNEFMRNQHVQRAAANAASAAVSSQFNNNNNNNNNNSNIRY